MRPSDACPSFASYRTPSPKRRITTSGVLTLLGTTVLVLLNQTGPSQASVTDGFIAERLPWVAPETFREGQEIALEPMQQGNLLPLLWSG